MEPMQVRRKIRWDDFSMEGETAVVLYRGEEVDRLDLVSLITEFLDASPLHCYTDK